MSGDRDDELREALRDLQRSLTRIAGELRDTADQVGRVLRAGDGAPDGAPVTPPQGIAPRPEFHSQEAPRPGWQQPGRHPGPSHLGATPAGLPPTGVPSPPPAATFASPPAAAFASPPGSAPLVPGSATRRPVQRPPGSWADTAGLKVLGWVGGGVTVLGIVLLLVIAAQQGGLSATARVVIGLVLGIALCVGGVLLHRDPERAALGVTIACTGLAVEYLTVVGAVRLADLVPPIAGFLGSAVIVAVAVQMSRSWHEPWLAGASFLVSGLLAPAVGGGVTDAVLVFEAIMLAGGALCLLLDVGLLSWAGAGLGVAVVCLTGIVAHPSTPARLLVMVVVAAVTWATMLTRWLTGRTVSDPGPFPLRVPSHDPAQVARDYADFHAHQRVRAQAQADSVIAALSIGISAGLLILAVARMDRGFRPDGAAAIAAGVLALIFGLLAWVGWREAVLRPTVVTVTAWSSAIVLAAVALLRAIGGDARGVAWVMLGAVALAVAAANRSVRLLWPGLAAALVALLSTGTVVHPADLLGWRPPSSMSMDGLLGPAGLEYRAWAVLLPTGLAVIVLAAVAWWAVVRCTANVPARTQLLTWSLVACVVVAIYGLLAVTMVLAYAISPTEAGYQGGQVAVTALITVAGLLLLWQGFRQVVLRIGGLVLAGLAVAKLLLFDTRSLSAMPRAVTFIVVGVLLLISAVVYLRTTSRAARRSADG